MQVKKNTQRFCIQSRFVSAKTQGGGLFCPLEEMEEAKNKVLANSDCSISLEAHWPLHRGAPPANSRSALSCNLPEPF